MTATSRTAGAAVVCAAALALAACGSPGGDAETPRDPVSGGVLRYAVDGDADCLDPHQSAADVAGFLSRPLLDSLVALDAAGGLHPWLAERWTVSPDGSAYTFTLREGVTFSNGETFDAAAVKANFDHVVDPRTQSKLAAGKLGRYRGAVVVDPRTVRIELSAPNSAFLPAVATAYLGMEAPSTLTGDPGELCSRIVGTGPFVSADGYVPQRGIAYVKRADHSWAPANAGHDGAPYLDGIDVRVVTENASRLGALTGGQVDAIAGVPPVNVAQLQDNPAFSVRNVQAPGGNYSYYPNTRSGPFTDVRVRTAFRVGIDWATIVDKLYFGVHQPARGPLSPATVGYDSSIEAQHVHDEQEAARLLDEAGWTGRDAEGFRTKDGARLTLEHPFLKAYLREQRDVLADQIQAAARRLGIEVRNVNTDFGGFFELLAGGTGYDLADMSWQQASPDALRTLFASENVATPQTGFGTNVGRYQNPEVDSHLAAALAATDAAQRDELYAKAQRQITADAAVFPVYVFSYVLGTSRAVQGVTFEPQGFPVFYDAWLSR